MEEKISRTFIELVVMHNDILTQETEISFETRSVKQYKAAPDESMLALVKNQLAFQVQISSCITSQPLWTGSSLKALQVFKIIPNTIGPCN